MGRKKWMKSSTEKDKLFSFRKVCINQLKSGTILKPNSFNHLKRIMRLA
jgi:hypothetical protein